MADPVTTVLSAKKELENIKIPAAIVEFKDKVYMVTKNTDGLHVFIKKARGYYLLKTKVGQGVFKEMFKVTKGARLPPGFLK